MKAIRVRFLGATNSHGSLSVAELDYRLVCLNGMIRAHAIRKAHLGRGQRGAAAANLLTNAV